MMASYCLTCTACHPAISLAALSLDASSSTVNAAAMKRAFLCEFSLHGLAVAPPRDAGRHQRKRQL